MDRSRVRPEPETLRHSEPLRYGQNSAARLSAFATGAGKSKENWSMNVMALSCQFI